MADFAGLTMERDPLLYYEDPWLDYQAVLRPKTWLLYVDSVDDVTGGIHGRAVESFEWRQSC